MENTRRRMCCPRLGSAVRHQACSPQSQNTCGNPTICAGLRLPLTLAKQVLLRESNNEFTFHASGRRFCTKLGALLVLRRRQDLLSLGYYLVQVGMALFNPNFTFLMTVFYASARS